MKNNYIFFLLLLLPFTICAQSNLVDNPSFEQLDSCPYSVGQAHFATGWTSYKQTPDYFNSCNFPNSLVGIPDNIAGHQIPHYGNAYIGIQTFFTPGTRELIGSALLSNLIIGQEYYFSMYVSCGFDTALIGDACASNNLGVKFSTVPFDINHPAPIDNFAHIYSDSLIVDTAAWVQIKGSFIADSSYGYIIIGNFFDDMNTDTIQFIHNYSRCYYFIDDICLSTTDECILFNNVPELNYFADIKWYYDRSNNLVFDAGNKTINSWSIYDIIGQKILKDQYVNGSKIVQCSFEKFKPGIYVAKLISEKKEFTFKFIIY
jgi:hypothetical protein